MIDDDHDMRATRRLEQWRPEPADLRDLND